MTIASRPAAGVLEEVRLSIHHRHGSRHLSDALGSPAGPLGALAGLPDLGGRHLSDLLFLDTETTGLGMGAGTLVFLVGVGRFEAGSFVVRHFFLEEPDREGDFLDAVLDHIGRAPGLVTFNGRRFDLPQLETRLILNRRGPCLPGISNLDLLPVARRVWKLRLESRSLSSLEGHVLGFVREDDVPGWLVPSFYREYLLTGNRGRLKPVFHHNLRDILSLVTLACHLGAWADEAAAGRPPAGAHPLEMVGLAHACEAAGWGPQSTACYGEAIARGLDAPHQHRTRERLGRVYRRLGQHDAAATVWQQAIAAGSPSPVPYVELARHYERVRGDLTQALAVVNAAIDRLDLSSLQRSALSRRAARLCRRMGMSGRQPAY
ncbi:MAG TPA: hypothetical protein DEQ28_03335 [Clostridiales bacterium]|nr:hypothetical protein [Clostridiales bacterium]